MSKIAIKSAIRTLIRFLTGVTCIGFFLFWGNASYGQATQPIGNPAVGEEIVSAYQCAQCHSSDGAILKPGVPNLSSQKAAFLVRTMMHMRLETIMDKDGKLMIHRHHPVMTKILNTLSPWQIRQIAAYYEQQACIDQSVKPIEMAPPRGIDHCITCHGGKDSSNPWQDTPYLAGQDETYLKQQIQQLWETQAREQAGPKRYHRLAGIMFFPGHKPYLDAYAEYYAGLSCSLRVPGND